MDGTVKRTVLDLISEMLGLSVIFPSSTMVIKSGARFKMEVCALMGLRMNKCERSKGGSTL